MTPPRRQATDAGAALGLKWLVVVLAAANLAVVAAWLGRDALVDAGILAGPPPARVEAGAWPMPPVAAHPSAAPGAEPSVPPAEPSTGPADADDQDAAPPPTPKLACVVAGRFFDAAAAEALRGGLAAHAGDARVVEDTVPGEPDYLVHIEVGSSRNLARRTAQELKAQGVDAYVIPSGERENDVSVGVFNVRKWAVAMRDRMKGLGYTVQLATLERSQPVYRVEARDVPPEALADTAHDPCAGAEVAEPTPPS